MKKTYLAISCLMIFTANLVHASDVPSVSLVEDASDVDHTAGAGSSYWNRMALDMLYDVFSHLPVKMVGQMEVQVVKDTDDNLYGPALVRTPWGRAHLFNNAGDASDWDFIYSDNLFDGDGLLLPFNPPDFSITLKNPRLNSEIVCNPQIPKRLFESWEHYNERKLEDIRTCLKDHLEAIFGKSNT